MIVVAYHSILLQGEGTVGKVSIPHLHEKDILENSIGFLSQHSILSSHLTLKEAQMTAMDPGPYQGCLYTLRLTQEPAKRRAKSAREDGQRWNTVRNLTGPLLPRLTGKEPEETTVEGETFDELNWMMN